MKPDCPRCGAPGVGGIDGCEEIFQEVIAREFSDPGIFQVHRLTVDCYSLQHPERYMRSGKSFAAHLTGMLQALELGGGPEISRLTSRWLDGVRELPRPDPPPPGARGEITVLYVYHAEDSREHIERVRRWAESVWTAWGAHHALARRWVEELISR